MSTVLRLALHSRENAKVTPLEVLQDFADATSGWGYLEADSRHYTEVKNAPGLVIRHRPSASTFIDLGFVETSPRDGRVELAVLDQPDADTALTEEERSTLLDSFLKVLRNYLRERPDHVTIQIEEDRPNPTMS